MGRAILALHDPNGLDLPPKQEALAVALAAGSSLKEAARLNKVGETTAKKWLTDIPAIARRVSALRAEMTKQAMGQLVANMVSAVATLGYLCRKGKTETVRLNAARSIIELGLKGRLMAELEEKFETLERQGAGRSL